MSNYIDREAAANIFSRARAAMKPQDYHTFGEMNTRDLMLLNAEQAIRAIPAADVVEVRRGHWIWHDDDYEYECSACHIRFDYDKTYALFDDGYLLATYCPHCGAKMDVSEEDDNG